MVASLRPIPRQGPLPKVRDRRQGAAAFATRDSTWVIPATILLTIQHAAALVISRATHFAERPPTLSYMIMALVLSLAGGLVLFLRRLFILWREDEANPTRRILAETDYRAVATYIVGFQMVALQMAALTWLKEMIPLVAPFWADPLLASLERSLFSVDAWRLVPEILVRPLDAIYPSWAPIKFLALLLMLCLPASKLKAQALLAYFLTLGLLGVSGQFLLSSAGPIFYDRLLGGDQFAALASRLDQHAPIANLASTYLWREYMAPVAGIGTGISAMPSIHVAMAAWIALALSAVWPNVRVIMWSYWLTIFVGSFALGWHYLLDGVIGTLGAVACWMLAAWHLNVTTRPASPLAVAGAE